MDFQTVVSAIRRRWWVLLVTALVGIFVSNLVSTHDVRQYTATTRLFVAATGGGNSSSEAYSGGQFSEQRVQSYAQMITGQQLTRRVVDRLRLPLSADELSSKVNAAIVPRTVLLDVSATDPSPERATDIANALADEFIQYVGPLETPIGESSPRATVTVVNRAQIPSTPSSPHVVTNAVYGCIGGLLFGLLCLASIPVVSRRINSAEELSRLTGAPTAGPLAIPDPAAAPHRLFDASGPESENLRRLRVQIDAHDPAPQVLLVAPASGGRAAAALGAGIAAALAETGRTTALVAADPTLQAGWFDVRADAPGLADVLCGRAGFDDVLHSTTRPGLSVVPHGAMEGVEALLSSAAMSAFVDDLRKEFDRVVIVTPSVIDSSAAPVLSAVVDADLLAVDTSTSHRGDVATAIRELAAARAHLLTVVMTHVTSPAGAQKTLKGSR
ncbi:Wzz/FepE/Etk N-terminal domain-containing protein [Mycolicibacterium sp. 018/SC-01/001]|uniref:Wzz/FepE/Etk N-terminal domain-containing protein n=1 Tax=Mycolicibacterium sp. 018/SC-01/001 TaxID=2592069 RepID=UPI00163D5CE8|nr:Wzz/FepE/Etk N-terminal domain-containing protein [Mycolicibacterium sp. 018/SC-01/001]